MLLIDRRILAGGLAMLAIGLALSGYIGTLVPVGEPGMSEEEIQELLTKQQENQDLRTLAGILTGVGFLLVLVSFGARRKRRGGPKRVEKSPDIGM